MTDHDRDFASHRFTLRQTQRYPISGPAYDAPTTALQMVAWIVVGVVVLLALVQSWT